MPVTTTGDTKQLVILKALTTLIETITTDNDYDFDLEGHVFRGKGIFGSQEPMPFVSIRESPRPDPRPDEGGYGKPKRTERWELLVQGWVKTSQENPTDDLYGLKGAIEHRLQRINDESSDDYRLGGLVHEVQIGPGVVVATTPQSAGQEALYLPLIVVYTANVADPWAVPA